MNKILLSHMLNLAADEFADHACNDFDLALYITDPDERNAFVKAFHECNGDPEEYEPSNGTRDYRLPDFAIYAYLAYLALNS